jgi:uncharacterized damage-inducible protein DinB
VADDQTRQQKIAALRSLPDDVRRAIAGLNDAQLDTPYRDGGWTVRQVVHHLADSHMNAYIRARLTLTEQHPTLRPYDQDAWARLTDAAGAPVAPSLTILDGVHDRFVRLLEQCSDTDWARPAHHPDSGAMTLETILTTYSAHGTTHVGQILGLRKRKGW